MVQPGEDIAIIGVSGRYPNSDTLEEFWENIAGGKTVLLKSPRNVGISDQFTVPTEWRRENQQ